MTMTNPNPKNDLALNPNLLVTPKNEAQTLLITTYSRILGQREWLAGTDHDLRLLRKVVEAQKSGSLDGFGPDEVTKLQGMGIIVRPEEISSIVKYRCVVDIHAAETARQISGLEYQDWALNPKTVLAHDGNVPERFADRLEDVESLDLSGSILWVEEPITGVITPYAVSAQLASCYEALKSDPTPIRRLDRNEHAQLAAIDALVPIHLEGSYLGARLKNLHAAGDSLKQNGYAIFDQLIPVPALNAMREYFKRMTQEGRVAFPDPQNAKHQSDYSNRDFRHEDGIAHYFHQQMGQLISIAMKSEWKASYAFYARYKPGGELHKHKDRKQCQLSLSLLVDYEPSSTRGETWPLYIETRESGAPKTSVLRWQVGQAGAFHGIENPHWRDKLEGSHAYMGIFLHFVRADFDGPLT